MPAPKQEIIFYSQKSRDALSKKINRYVNQPLPPTPRYSLHLMSQDSVLKRDRIYVSTEQDKLKYKVIAPSGELQEGEITTRELGAST